MASPDSQAANSSPQLPTTLPHNPAYFTQSAEKTIGDTLLGSAWHSSSLHHVATWSHACILMSCIVAIAYSHAEARSGVQAYLNCLHAMYHTKSAITEQQAVSKPAKHETFDVYSASSSCSSGSSAAVMRPAIKSRSRWPVLVIFLPPFLPSYFSTRPSLSS